MLPTRDGSAALFFGPMATSFSYPFWAEFAQQSQALG
jgi:hypothetical protein